MDDIKQVVQKLLDDGYMVLVNDSIVTTSKLSKALGLQPQQEFTAREISNELTKPTTHTTDEKSIWNMFITDAEIPYRVTAKDGSTYTVRQYGALVAKRLIAIIKRRDIDYTRLVESTKNYYKTITYKPLLANYIAKNIWYDEYMNWGKQSKTTNDGGNRWESE